MSFNKKAGLSQIQVEEGVRVLGRKTIDSLGQMERIFFLNMPALSLFNMLWPRPNGVSQSSFGTDST